MEGKQKIEVLIVGATGKLGSLVTKHSLKEPNLVVNILVRNPQKDVELKNEVEKAGGRVIKGDAFKAETLTDSTKGIHTVICCLPVFGEADVQAQNNILEDAIKNGVKRFFSSHFGINYENAKRDNALIDAKLKLKEAIEKTQIKPVVISCGSIRDFFLGGLSKDFTYWGDINQKMDYTSYDDLAKYVVAVTVDPDKYGDFSFVGEELSTKELADIYNRVRGTNIVPRKLGTIEELKSKAKEAKKKGEFEGIFFDLYYLIYSGKGKIQKNNNNQFPQVKSTSFEDFLKSNPEFQFNSSSASDDPHQSHSQPKKINILIVGATGKLGSLVTKHSLKQPNLNVSILVRNPDKEPVLLDEVKKSGGRIIVGDVSKPETLKDSTKGIHTVICCIPVFGEADVQAQNNILEDALKNGVKRFFSSHFGISYENAKRDNALIDAKLKLKEAIEKTQIKPVAITCGSIRDFFFSSLSKDFTYWGDINQKMDFTSYDDLAKYVVAVAVDPDKYGDFSFVGEELSTKDLADIYNKVRGTNIVPRKLGTIGELKNKAELAKTKGGLEGIFLDIHYLIYSGKGKIQKNHNSQFPQVRPTSFEEFLKNNPDFKFSTSQILLDIYPNQEKPLVINVLIVGATGKLGSLVTRHALKQSNLHVSILVRNPEKEPDLNREVQKAGGRVIVGDLSIPATIKDSTMGIHTVICCIPVFGKEDVQAQNNILEDAIKNGVKRFFSSHFGINYQNAKRDNALIDAKLELKETLEKTQIKPVVITCGSIRDFFLGGLSKDFTYWGDINQKMDFTSYDDLAKYVVAVAVDPDKYGDFSFVGEELSTKDITDIYNRVRRTHIKPRKLGTIEELRRKAEEAKMQSGFEGIFFDIFYLIYSGKGKIIVNNNKEFPQVRPTSFEDFLRSDTDFTLNTVPLKKSAVRRFFSSIFTGPCSSKRQVHSQ